jgi:hypothetical protein
MKGSNVLLAISCMHYVAYMPQLFIALYVRARREKRLDSPIHYRPKTVLLRMRCRGRENIVSTASISVSFPHDLTSRLEFAIGFTSRV